MKVSLPNNIAFNSSTFAIVGIAIGAFVLFIVMAHMSRGFLSWSLSGAGIGFIAGIVTTVAALGLILYFGGGALKAILTWDKAPKPVKSISNVLGVKTEKISPDTLNSDYNNLTNEEKNSVKNNICKP